jgi:long-chain acyl-CoA synthetase
MDKIWLKSYPAGMPAEINPEEYPSLGALLADACTQYADRPAFSNLGKTISYGKLRAMSLAFGAWLQKEAGLVKGDRIALMMPNILQYPIALFGALEAGLIVVNTNPLYTRRELEHQLKDSGAKALVVYEQAASLVQECLPVTDISVVIVTGIGDLLGFPKAALCNFLLKSIRREVPPYVIPNSYSFMQVLEQGKWVDLDAPHVTPSDIAFLQYTGGTTGVSKGAVLTHRNMVANTLQAALWGGQFIVDKTKQQRILGALPLYHIFALTAVAFVWLKRGGHTLLITNPRDIKALVTELKTFRCTIYYGVNTLFNTLLHTPDFESVDFSELVTSTAGGMALQAAVALRWKNVTGTTLSQGWGLTETSPVVTMCPVNSDFNNSIGLPIPSTDISVRDDLGTEVAIGELGELCVKGPQVMQGYWNRPDETQKAMLDGVWFRTGDIGRIDPAGFLYIEDRKKDMILVSGFNVYPNEVEGIIAHHPGVQEVAAIAEPDEHSGEVVAVFVVRKDPSLTAEQIIEYARKELTGYKVPKHVYFRNELPKTNVGKILRRELRNQLPKSH